MIANVAHSTLTGSNLHEPKGISTAAAGTVYISNGAGTGSWTASESIATGMIADFTTPVVPTGWLELDGSAVSTTTYSALYTAMTIQQSGARGSGSAIITGLSSTTNMRPGYFVFGTGITSGTTILTVDSSTQITMSANAGSSGTATVIVSPWLVAATTITLPNTLTSGRYRRSRTSALHIGVTQADQNKAHTHTLSGTAVSDGAHTHGISDPGHFHDLPDRAVVSGGSQSGVGSNSVTSDNSPSGNKSTGISINTNGAHTHTLSGTAVTDGGTETRPLTLIVMTCVKT